MEKISNKYLEMQQELLLEKKILFKKMRDSSEKIKNSLATMQLGDDSKVEEALMLSFLMAIYQDVEKAYNRYRELGLKKEIEELETNNTLSNNSDIRIEKKLTTLEKFSIHPQKLNKYYRHSMKKTLLESDIANKFINEDEKSKAYLELEKILKEMDAISNFYEHKNNKEFLIELKKAEINQYGENWAGTLELLRTITLPTDTLKELNIEDVNFRTVVDNEDGFNAFIKQFQERLAEKAMSETIDELASQVNTEKQEELV